MPKGPLPTKEQWRNDEYRRDIIRRGELRLLCYCRLAEYSDDYGAFCMLMEEYPDMHVRVINHLYNTRKGFFTRGTYTMMVFDRDDVFDWAVDKGLLSSNLEGSDLGICHYAVTVGAFALLYRFLAKLDKEGIDRNAFRDRLIRCCFHNDHKEIITNTIDEAWPAA